MYQEAPEGIWDSDGEERDGRFQSWPGADRIWFAAGGYWPCYLKGGPEDSNVKEVWGDHEPGEDDDTFIRLESTPPWDWDATQELSHEASQARNTSADHTACADVGRDSDEDPSMSHGKR